MKRWQAPLQLVGIGWFIAICIIIGIWGGVWLDGKTGTSPLFTVVGIILGVAVAFYGVYRMIMPNISKKQGKGKG
jgi:ATP synthase protein I